MITFKSEHSMFEMLKDGSKRWDGRKYDLADDRIYRLCWMVPDRIPSPSPGPMLTMIPQEEFVSFWNKETGELIAFRYMGIEFEEWAPGWCFIKLGGRMIDIEQHGKCCVICHRNMVREGHYHPLIGCQACHDWPLEPGYTPLEHGLQAPLIGGQV